MKTAKITGNDHGIYEVIVGLKKGDKLFCHKTERSTTGMGLWSTELYDSFEKGKIYKVHHLYNWDGVMVAYVLDEDGCAAWAKPETFRLHE
jgi:hypothetical protein